MTVSVSLVKTRSAQTQCPVLRNQQDSEKPQPVKPLTPQPGDRAPRNLAQEERSQWEDEDTGFGKNRTALNTEPAGATNHITVIT